MGAIQTHFQEAHLDCEELKQMVGSARYGITNDVNHREMEDSFMNFASSTEARDAAFM